MNIEYAYGKRKGVILVIVIGVMLVIVILALAITYVMTQEAQVTEHKIKRMRAYYAAKAGVVYARDELRSNSNYSGGTINIGSGEIGYSSGGIPVNITVNKGAGVDSTDKITVNVPY